MTKFLTKVWRHPLAMDPDFPECPLLEVGDVVIGSLALVAALYVIIY